MQIYRLQPRTSGAYRAEPIGNAFHEMRLFSNRESLSPIWRPLVMRFVFDADIDPSTRNPIHYDLSYISGTTMLYSAKAVKVLQTEFKRGGEFLEVTADGAPYYVFHCLNVVDALDLAKSEVKYFRDGGVMKVNKFVLRSEAILNHDVFRVEHAHPYHIYVSDRIRKIVDAAMLTGFEFEAIWTDESESLKVSG